MRLLSIDVGIKNLAFCLLEEHEQKEGEENGEKQYKIIAWDSIDVSVEETHLCGFIDPKKKADNCCNAPAKYTKNGYYYCLKHSKKQELNIPTKELNIDYIKKQTLSKLYQLAKNYAISYTKPIKKIDLVNLFQEYIHSTCFDVIERKNAGKVDLVTIGKNMKKKFDDIFSPYEHKIDIILIENQISPIANRMKTIQGMLAQYFIMRQEDAKIEFVSASNKLKEFSEESDTTEYKKRKQVSIVKCIEVVNSQVYNHPMLSYFESHAKKDDLADSFLQARWFLTK